MQLQKIPIPTLWKVRGNSEGVEGFKGQFFVHCMKLNWNFQNTGGGGGAQTRKPSSVREDEYFLEHYEQERMLG